MTARRLWKTGRWKFPGIWRGLIRSGSVSAPVRHTCPRFTGRHVSLATERNAVFGYALVPKLSLVTGTHSIDLSWQHVIFELGFLI